MLPSSLIAWLVADLLYVPLFNPNADLSGLPNTCAYMQRCCNRPQYEAAFGEQHAALVCQKCEIFLQGKSNKMFGLF